MTKKEAKYLIISIVLFIISINLVVTTITMLNRRNRLVELEKDVIALREEEIALKEAIEYKQTDEFVEEFARNELNLIKPGEDVVVIGKNTVADEGGDTTFNLNTDMNTVNTPLKSWISLLF